MTAGSLSELLGIVGSIEFEEHGRMRVVDLHWSADRVEIRLQVDHGSGQETAWKLRFRGILEQSFTVVHNCGLNVWRRDHPAIDQYLQAREFLHFGKAPAAPHDVVGQLWEAHVSLVDDWIPFDRYLNCELSLARLLASGSGLLATGPSFIIAAYAAVLERSGCMPTMKRLPRRRKIDEAVLVHLGESFVVSEQVTARRIAG